MSEQEKKIGGALGGLSTETDFLCGSSVFAYW